MQVSQELMRRSRSRSRSAESRPRSRRRQERPQGQSRLSRSIRGPKVHTIVKSCSITQSYSTLGIVPQVGLTASTLFSIWFTNQNAYIWINATNYSTVAVPGYTDLSALFDEVKIDAIQMHIIIGTDPTTSGSGSGVLSMATDYNDKVAPASLTDVQQYEDVKIISLANNYQYKEIIRPKFLTYTLESTGSAIASTPQTGYIRSNLDIEHYGKKCAFVSVPPNNCIMTFVFRYKYLCKIAK